MYTVIIQNEKTMGSFSKYYPLFLEAINDDKVGVCRWIESGTSVDTALPELSSLTDDKEDWRAVIVRLYDENAMGNFASSPINPFDFNADKLCDDSWGGLPPIVRLAQILGGAPATTTAFETTIEDDDEYAPSRMVFTPVDTPEDVTRREETAEKYYYNGKHPSEIVLVSLRKKAHKPKDDIADLWKNHSETRSSEFWKRNRYPSVCRFMVYEMEQQGAIVEAADLFKFWSAVMLVSVNKIEPNVLQAYRLYRFAVEIDKENMKLCFQQTFNRLISARSYVGDSIKQDEADAQLLTGSVDEAAPGYEMEVAVVVKTPKKSEKISIKPKAFGLFAGNTSEELNKWDNMRKTAEDKVKLILKSAEQSLDMTADKVRDRLDFEECKAFPVDKYQIQDIETDLDATYRQILLLQSALPRESSSVEKELKEEDKLVKDKIALRMTGRKAFGGYGIIGGLALLASIPMIYLFAGKETGSPKGLLITLAVCVVTPIIIELLVLLFQRWSLRKLVRDYKRKLNGFLTRLHASISEYSKYMSLITSHARGRSFLRTVKSQKMFKENIFTAKHKHVKDINIFISYINEWGRAFYIPVEYDEAEVYSYVDIDINVPSDSNPFYTFGNEMNYQARLNDSGDLLDSSVDFIEKMIIEREELYDDE